GKYAQAEPLYQRALAIREKALGPEHPQVSDSLNDLAILYWDQGKYAQAEPLHQRARAIWEKALGPEHPDVARSLNNLAGLYRDQGKYAQAEPLYQRARAIWEKALGPEHPDVADSLNNLAILYWEQGKYAQAEPLAQRALAIREKALGLEHPDVARSLNNLAGLYRDQGKYAQAEPPYQRALAIWEKVLGPEHPDVAYPLHNLALLYWDQGKYAQAEPLYQRALAIWEKALGPEHPEVAMLLNNLAGLYTDQGKYAQAEPLHQRALAIREKALGPEHPDVAESLHNLAILYRDQGEYAQAEPLAQRARVIWEKALGPEHPQVARSLNNLANLYYDQGKYAQAELLHERALAILAKSLGPEHPDVGRSLRDFALLYYAREMSSKAEAFFERSLQNLAKQFEHHFTYMSEKERLLFLDTVADAFPLYFSFCFTYTDQNPVLLGKMYDVLLWQKGFVATSVAALRTQIAASGDPQALALLDQLTAKRTQLANLRTTQSDDPAQWRQRVEQLEQEANDLERELVRRSTRLAEEKRLAGATWRDVKKALKKDEAAVEFVRFQYHDSKRWTDKTYYTALIVTPESTTAPTLVVLGEAAQLEGRPLQNYRKLVSPQGGAADSVYATFWKPLEAALGQARRIYLSPDGILNLISWSVIPRGDGGLLLDAYDLRVVSSTKDFLREKRTTAPNTAVLIGNPRFSMEEAKQRAAARTLQPSDESWPLVAAMVRGSRSRDQQRGLLSALPGTKAELGSIAPLLQEHDWQVELYSEHTALEEAIKRVRRPGLLHLATHGFFFSDQETKRREDPMLRSGLYFGGANRVLAGAAPPADLEDGVLTAYEASGLNLQGTQLVVLSACETGLGQVTNGEGVFGLRRALQVAGAEAILMSLWEVADRETQELMTLFYDKWLSGLGKQEALREAQLELRDRLKARYGLDLPHYWGAFVLLGR
ncbi:tetratricopeptide repeat protein, partial [Acidobacteria bacterium AH-259-D05]|nr:tetratricopeptide repeat protein [Acidobacteria bacterium AH-259-D05]